MGLTDLCGGGDTEAVSHAGGSSRLWWSGFVVLVARMRGSGGVAIGLSLFDNCLPKPCFLVAPMKSFSLLASNLVEW